MEWGHPENWIWFWSVFLVALIFWISQARKSAAMRRFGEPDLVKRLAVSYRPGARILKRLLLLAILALFVASLAEPHRPKPGAKVERKGVDVVIAIDVSNSMLSKDLAPNRLEKAKRQLTDLIDGLKGDRIGIVAFAGDAIIQCPLTLDHGAARLFLSTVSPNLIPYQGTDLSKAILASLQAFGDKEKGSKAIILLTDGESHVGDAMKAAHQARSAGVRIFTVGIGTAEGSTVPEDASGTGYKKDQKGEVVLSKLNESLLRLIAEDTGGAYFRSSRSEAEIGEIDRRLRLLAQKTLGTDFARDYREYFQYLLGPAVFLLLFEFLISERGRRERPK